MKLALIDDDGRVWIVTRDVETVINNESDQDHIIGGILDFLSQIEEVDGDADDESHDGLYEPRAEVPDPPQGSLVEGFKKARRLARETGSAIRQGYKGSDDSNVFGDPDA